jgi:hypothetical protein
MPPISFMNYVRSQTITSEMPKNRSGVCSSQSVIGLIALPALERSKGGMM